MTKPEKIAFIKDKIKDIKTAVLVTCDVHGHLHGRPMSTQQIDENGDLWFITSKDSKKVRDIGKYQQVGVMYGKSDTFPFVSISGSAIMTNDREKIRELWNDAYKAWFTDENDPNIILIKVTIIGAGYWDHTGGKIGAYLEIAESILTGEPLEDDDSGKMKVS